MWAAAFLTPTHVISATTPRRMICKRHAVTMKRTVDASGVEFIRLDTFVKVQGGASTGGQAKIMITGGDVIVNGDVETRRGRKLRQGDIVTVDGVDVPVVFEEDQD